ncbi:tetratricopeptide repeat protein [Nonomuraea sp. B10E15]|uniref:tetratricopeptide repeat protein n=1 Tax=Nonomuraea sp. B10E15 TaxID=3153560 RepID=UPI00325D9507
MDTPPHRLALERVVEVYSGHDDLVGVTGSGYVIGADLVLASGQVVGPGRPCQVRAPWSARWIAAEQVWRGRGAASAVLLRVPGSPWAELPGIEHVRWARAAAPGVRCLARGFPRAGQRAGFRDAETLAGVVDAPADAASKALTVSVGNPGSHAVPGSLWGGLPGAALLAEPAGQLIGVITSGTAPRLDAVPVTALLSDARFRELAGVPPGRLETVTGDEPSVPLADLLSPARDDPPPDGPGWTLLQARHAVVPFLGREEELARLRAWAAEPAPLSIAVLTGRAGTGKSRLAGELCAELAGSGWDAGLLPLDALCDLDPEPDAAAGCAAVGGRAGAALDAVRPTLLVVEHPEPSVPLVGELIRRLAKHGRNPRVRLLLVAREPGEPGWWRRLDTAAGGWLRRLNTTTIQLNTRPLTLPERTEHARAAMKAFAPSRAALPAPPHLDDPEYGLPLHVHLAALMRLRDEGEHARGGLLERFVARELHEWAPARPAGHQRTDDVTARQATAVDAATARQAVAVVTLTAPTPAELPGLLAAVPGLRDAASSGPGLDGPVHDVVAWLRRILPGGERLVPRLVPLGPDLVAEQLLSGTEDLESLVLAVHDLDGRTTRHLVRMLDVLRVSAGGERVRSALRTLVTARAGNLVEEAVTRPGTRLGDLVDAVLGLFPAEPEAMAALPVRAGRDRLGLRALDVTLGELAVHRHRARGERFALAEALSTVSGRLAAAGRVGEAVAAAAEAVEIHAAAPPYEEVAGRAEALFDLGACLLLAGEAGGALKPAQEAAARFRKLAGDDPRYADAAARAHHNLACALLETGRLGEAVRAYEAAGGDGEFAGHLAALLSVPAARHPGTTSQPPAPPSVPAPRLGRSGSPLGEAGTAVVWTGGAGAGGVVPSVPGAAATGGVRPLGVPVGGTGFPTTDAVAAPAPLMRFDGPDPAAVPELAACLARAATAAVEHVAPTSRDVARRLHLLAAWLEARDKPADALVPAGAAAVRLRGLAAEGPEPRSMLAETACMLARLHTRLDDLDAAARSASEAVRNLRALVALDPGGHRTRLAGQLLVLGELLLADDRPEAALGPLQEVMCVAAERHTATRANARRLLGLCLDELGRTADGAAQLEAAAELYDLAGGHARQAAAVRARLERMRTAPDVRDVEQPWLLAMVARDPGQAVSGAEQRLAECRQSFESAGVPGLEEIHAYLAAQATLARAWADAGRAGDGLALATQAAELLQRYPVPDRPHAIAVGMVAAALGRSLAGLGRHEEAVPHLRTAIESYEPQTGTSAAFRTELAELAILETVALSRAGCPPDAEAAADRLAGLYEGLVADGLHDPLAHAGALRLQGGIRFARRNPEGALQSVTRALDVTGTASGDGLLVATCLELGGLCLAELGRSGEARAKLEEGTASLAKHGRVPPDLVDAHVLALIRLAGLRVAEEGPAAGVALWARILGMRPLPGVDVLEALVESLAGFAGDVSDLGPALAAFTDALEREVPLSGTGPELHAKYGRCLARFRDAAAPAGDDGTTRVPPERATELTAELTIRVHRNLAAASGAHRTELGLALAALARIGHADLAVMEQAIDLLTERPAGTPDRPGERPGGKPRRPGERPGDTTAGTRRRPGGALVDVLNRYAVRLLEEDRAVEALAHCERAADLCDELDDPALAAVTYARLGTGLSVLDRPQAALEAITWSLAELDRAAASGQELPHVRAEAVRVRGQVLRAFGRGQEALAHLVAALELFVQLSDDAATADTAATIADDLLASGRVEEAAGYARTAATGYAPGTVKHALAVQRLARCHLVLGELTEANALVEQLIPLARRSPDELTHRAILADSLAQSSELLPLLGLDGGTEAETRAREAIAIYDELLAAGMEAQALHTGRAGACLTLASALRMQGMAADAIQPLREAVAALERHGPGHPMLLGLLSRGMLMLGDALMEAGRALEAGLVFHRAAQVTRDTLFRAVAHAKLGLCQEELARDDAADAALRVSAGLLRDLLADGRGEGPAELLRDVLHGRLRLMERAGRNDEATAIQDELHRLARTQAP